jgi:prepilin-type processing-associated H-X9-DG protein
VSETAHRRVRVIEIFVSNPTTPGNSSWVNVLFFDGLNAGINSLIDYDVATFNRKRFQVISDRVFNLNSIKQADNVTKKVETNKTI